MLLYQWCHKYVTIIPMTSYGCLSDVIEITFCQVLSPPVCNSLVAMATDLWGHLTCNSRGAWHTVYAMLLLNYKWDVTWNSNNGKVLFSHPYNSFSNNFILCFTVQILFIGTERSQQTVQTKIRLLLKKQSDQALRCLPFHQHLLDALMQCYIKLFYF